MNHDSDRTDGSLLEHLLSLARHPRALHREQCPTIDELRALAAAAAAADASRLESARGRRHLFQHLGECDLCRTDFTNVRAGVRAPAAPDEPAPIGRTRDEVRTMASELFHLSDALLNWSRDDVMIYRPVIELIVRLTHVSLRSIEAVRRGKRRVMFATPDASRILDRILAGALAGMRAGDSYASTTTLAFWREILTDASQANRSAFLQRMVQALNLGVSIRRMLPVSIGDLELLEALAHLRATGDASGFPAAYSFLVPHVALAKQYPNYEFRVLLTGTDRHPEPPPHFGVGHWPQREVRVTFCPKYEQLAEVTAAGASPRLVGLEVVTQGEDAILEQFEGAWRDAVDIRELGTGMDASRWLASAPTEALMGAVELLPPPALERLEPALVAEWERRGLEGMPPFVQIAAG